MKLSALNFLPEKHKLKFFEITQNLSTATFLAGLATHFDFYFNIICFSV